MAGRATILLAAALALCLLASGCGESDTSGRPAAAPPREPVSVGTIDKGEYVARASGVCEASWGRMLATFPRRYPTVARAYQDEATQHRGEGARFQSAVDRVFLPGLQDQLDELRAIPAPRADRRQIELILGEMRHSIDRASAQQVESARRFMELFSHFSTLAWEYGLNPCLVYESDFRETD